MSQRPDNDKLILEQAARWHMWLRDNRADPDTVDVFRRWRDSNHKHQSAYERIESLWRQCDGIDPLDLPWPTALELSLDQYDGSYALPLPERRNPLLRDETLPETSAGRFVLNRKPLARKVSSGRQRLWRLAASLGAVALIVGLAAPFAIEGLNDGTDSLIYSTPVAQKRVERLDDGSAVTLGGDSRITVAFDRHARQVVLERGEVYFDVAKDASRPFTVTVGNSRVRAVGTAFNINKHDQAVIVSVVEGVVDVTRETPRVSENRPAEKTQRARLERGQELVYDRSGAVWDTRTAESLERVVAWRDGRLAFVNERLDLILQDVNRYSDRRLVIGDKDLAQLRYTGTVFSTDIPEWLAGLEQAFNIRALTVDGNIVLLKNANADG